MENEAAKVDNSGDFVEKPGNNGPDHDTPDYESLYKDASTRILEITAERDSLKNENDALRKSSEDAIKDAAKVRETNYTLARQLDISQQKASDPEDILADMFKLKGGT